MKGGQDIAIFHCSIKIIKRSEGRSAVAAAAYRSGEKLTNSWDGMTHDYTNKGGIVHSEILLPSHAPPEFKNRSELWNSAEEIEMSRNSQLAREIEIALPVELDRQKQIELIRTYVQDTFVDAGMCADFALHDKGDGNPHAHIMLTMRPINEDGTWGAKCRKEYELDGDGQRIQYPSGEYKSHRVNTTDWNDRDKAEQWRFAWAEYANRALEEYGIAERIDHRSYSRQGVSKIPTIHLGVAATRMEKRGISTDKGNINREVAAQNKLLKEIKARITRLYNWSAEQAAQPEGRESVMAKLWQYQHESNQAKTQYGKIKNLKESAALFNFLHGNGISSMQELHDKVSDMNTDYYALRGEIVDIERQISALNKNIKMWAQYKKYKPIYENLDGLKPRKREAYENRHRSELIQFESAANFLKVLKANGQKITPKKWASQVANLTIQKDQLYSQMKSMREDIKAAERLRKTAMQLSKPEKTKRQEHEL